MKNRTGFCLLLLFCLTMLASAGAETRTVIRLDGLWEAETGRSDAAPEIFSRSIPVPGLIDLAEPAFDEPFAFPRNTPLENIPEEKRALWYRTAFKTPEGGYEVFRLKVHKAMYGTRVRLNGKEIGCNSYCYTPGYFDLSAAMHPAGEENELVIQVGTHYMLLPEDVPYNHCWETRRYLSGIYDSVDLICTGPAYVGNVQTVPQLENEQVRLVVEVAGDPNAAGKTVRAAVREKQSGRIVGEGSGALAVTDGVLKADFSVPVGECHPWSPEDPFLYEVETAIAGDSLQTTFGMREFRFDVESGMAVLNGRKRYLVGSNAAMFRFYEDPERGTLPWNREWAARWYERAGEMHYTIMRWHIGSPPELWFELADQYGMLTIDEFTAWGKDKLKPMSSKCFQEEFRRWMRERWNHPSVVVWDAQNEGGQGGPNAQFVRHLDLSSRPWDTGWSFSGGESDPIEAHPYSLRYLERRPATDEKAQGVAADRSKHVNFRDPEFIKRHGGLKIFETFSPNPFEMPFTLEAKHLTGNERNPVLINEYARLCWIHRDGTAAEGSANYFRGLGIDPDNTPEDSLRETAAYYLAAQTEFWRHGRAAAAVQHFVALTADKRKTSDNFTDIKTLEWDSYFRKYMPSAFAPVSVMIDLWDEAVEAGSSREVKVSVINDLAEPWQGEVTLSLLRDGKPLGSWKKPAAVESNGKAPVSFTVDLPGETGRAELHATLSGADGGDVLSRRRLNVLEKGTLIK